MSNKENLNEIDMKIDDSKEEKKGTNVFQSINTVDSLSNLNSIPQSSFPQQNAKSQAFPSKACSIEPAVNNKKNFVSSEIPSACELKEKMKDTSVIFTANSNSDSWEVLFGVPNGDEYIEDIYSNLLEDEENAPIKPEYDYMLKQKDINAQMRAILIDWIVEVHKSFNLKPNTLFIIVWIIDCYLTRRVVVKEKLQLLGIAAVLIASKLNDIIYPRIHELIGSTANAYTAEELMKMENDILKELSFNIFTPTALEFFDILSIYFGFDPKTYNLGCYFLESALMDAYQLIYRPSELACACAYIVMKFFSLPDYGSLYCKNMLRHEKPEKVIKDAARDICHLVKCLAGSNLKSLKNKYSKNELNSVSLLID